MHWQDDAFNYQGKAAWLTGDAASRKIILHTVDGNLNYTSYELGLSALAGSGAAAEDK